MDNNELQHWGVPGMKWGVRRYQNRDGTLTAAGKKRYDKELASVKEQQRVLKNKQKTQAQLDKLEAAKRDLENQKRALKGKPSIEEESARRAEARQRRAEAKRSESEAEASRKAIRKRAKDMTDEELKTAIDRMELEKRYKQLANESVTSQSPQTQQKSSAGKDFIVNTLKRSGENIAPQVLNAIAANALNQVFNQGFEKKTIMKKDGTKKDKNVPIGGMIETNNKKKN